MPVRSEQVLITTVGYRFVDAPVVYALCSRSRGRVLADFDDLRSKWIEEKRWQARMGEAIRERELAQARKAWNSPANSDT